MFRKASTWGYRYGTVPDGFARLERRRPRLQTLVPPASQRLVLCWLNNSHASLAGGTAHCRRGRLRSGQGADAAGAVGSQKNVVDSTRMWDTVNDIAGRTKLWFARYLFTT